MGAEALAEDLSEHLLDDSPRLLKDESLSSISPWARLLEKSDFVRIMHRHLLQAGLTWSVGRVTLLMLLASSVALGFAMQFDWIPGWADLLIAVAVGALPYLYILRCRAKRFRQFEENFPDALDSLARSLRAGHPFPAAMDILAEECEQPVAREMHQTAARRKLGNVLGAGAQQPGRAHAAARSEHVRIRRPAAKPHRRQVERSAGNAGREYARVGLVEGRSPGAGRARQADRRAC